MAQTSLSPIQSVRIKNLKSKVKFKVLTLDDSRVLNVPVSSCVEADSKLSDASSQLLMECRNGEAVVFPPYCEKDSITIGGLSISLLIKEITDEAEYESYQTLTKYHYKSQALFGRTSILLAINTTPYLPRVIGYIELATPFYVNKPRGEILNAPFKHNGIGWNSWDKETTKKYINTIVRIARCVVYPEFRGAGLGGKLIEHAEVFAKTRWQIGKIKPLFLEISADMLRYIPFAEKAGMHYIGETEGNLGRIGKDLAYLLRNYQRVRKKEIVSDHQMGIVEQQKSRLRKALKLAKKSNLTISGFIQRLEELPKGRLKDFTFFNGIISLPKPTYLKGLDGISDEFISQRLKKFSPRNNFMDRVRIERNNDVIRLDNLSIAFSSRIRRTKRTQAIHNAFSISPSEITSRVINDFSMKIHPGEIVLVTGSSGAGKTTLLNFLASGHNSKSPTVSGQFQFPSNYEPREFAPISSKKALVEYFGNEDVDYALTLMGNVGLSDAFVFVKRFSELSKGQQYRALLAKLIHERSNTIIVDEFCSNLDPVTANVLASKIGKLVRHLGITLVVGAAHCDGFVRSLAPDQVVRLSTAFDYDIIPGSEFIKQYSLKKHLFNAQRFRIKPRLVDLIVQGKKRSTIRKFSQLFKPGFTLLESGNRILPVYITEIVVKRFGDLTLADAQSDGFHSVKQLKRVLKELYPNIRADTKLSVLNFDLTSFE